nr:MAG TPA: hypothetical protein [Caudoviricetes sp.]
MAGYYDKDKDYSAAIVSAKKNGASQSEINRLRQERQNKINDKYGSKDPYRGKNDIMGTGGSSHRGSSSSGASSHRSSSSSGGSSNQKPQTTQTPQATQQAGYYDKNKDYSLEIVKAQQRGDSKESIDKLRQERQNKINSAYGSKDPYQGKNDIMGTGGGSSGGSSKGSYKGVEYTREDNGGGVYGMPSSNSEVKNYTQGGVTYSVGADMSRRQDLAGKAQVSNGYTVFYDDNGYAYKAVKGVADYTPHQDINAGNGSYGKSGAWTDNEMLSAADKQKIADIRAQMQAGKITGDQANQAANAIRAGYGYTIDKNGLVTDNGALSKVNDRRKQLGLSTSPENAELDYYRYLMGTDTSPTAQVNGKVQSFGDYLAENGGVQAGTPAYGQQRGTGINAGSTPASNLTAQTGKSYGIGDGSNYLKELYAQKVAAELAALKSAYEKNTSTLNASRAQIAPVYDIARNSAANQNALSRGRFQEMAVANGLNTGTTGQAALAQDVVLQQNLSQLDREQAEKTAAIDLQRSQLDTEYQNAIAEAQATGNAELANALYEEYVRQQNQAVKQTAAAAATTAAKPILTASQAQSALKNGIVTDDVISAFDYYYGQGSYDALYGTGRLTAGTTGTSKTGSKRSGKSSYSNGSLTNEQVKQLQKYYGVTADGKWGTNSKKAAGGLTADKAWAKYSKGQKSGYSMGYDELKRTISDYMNRGGYQRAQNILKSHWNSLSAAQQQEISNMFK